MSGAGGTSLHGVLGGKLARQPYYRWLRSPVSDAQWVQAHRVNALWDAHREDPTFGYRFLGVQARHDGWGMSRRTAWALCSQSGISSAAQRARRGKGRRPGPPVFDDLVRRVFRADAPNRLWLTDITEHPTREGKVYCGGTPCTKCLGEAIKDMYSGRIVGYSIADRMTARLAVDALNTAVARRGNVTGCVLHADRGSQFRSRKMGHALNRWGMVGSMGRVGAAETTPRWKASPLSYKPTC